MAVEQLRVHSQHIGSAKFPLVPLAPPPSHYAFNRGYLPVLCPSSETYKDEVVPMESAFVFCFHRPPYNSIDHLHLHAFLKPYRTWWNRFMFAEHSPWHGSLESVLTNLPSPKAKL